jgi:hypothetical protein
MKTLWVKIPILCIKVMYFGENLTLNLSKILHQPWVRLKKEIILGGGKRLIGIFLLEVRLL